MVDPSIIRTVTVGSGISPDLLTLVHEEKGARGLFNWVISPKKNTAGGEFRPAPKFD